MATAQDVIDRVREVINDNASAFITTVRWSDAELLLWITDAQREIVKTKPESYPLTRVFQTVPGLSRQRLDPDIAYRLIRVEANAVGDPTAEVELFDAQFLSASNSGSGALSATWTVPTFEDDTYAVVLLAFVESVSDVDALIEGLALDGTRFTVHSMSSVEDAPAIMVVASVLVDDLPLLAGTADLTTGDPASAAAGLFALYTLVGVDLNAPIAASAFVGALASEESGTVELSLPSVNFAPGQAVLAAYAQVSDAEESEAYAFTASEDDYDASTQMSDALEAEPLHEVQMTAQAFFGRATDPLLAWTQGTPVFSGAFAAIVSPDAQQYGDAVRIVERDVLDSFSPQWTRPSTQPLSDNYYRAYCMDGSDPLAFWLSPCPRAGKNVWLTYAGVAAALNDPEDLISLPDSYLSPIVDYTVYRALTKESREANREVAERFLRTFYASLGVHRPILLSIGQNATRPPEAAA